MAPAVPIHSGVRVKEKNVFENARKLAGYLGLDDTKSLRELLSSAEVEPVLTAFYNQYDKAFGHKGPNHKVARAVQVKAIIDVWNDNATRAEVNNATTVAVLCASDRDINGKLVFIKTIQALISAKPDVFKDTATPLEDVNRAFQLIKFFVKSKVSTRQPKGASKNDKAISVEWFPQPGEEPTSTQVEGGSQAIAIKALEQMGRVDDESAESDAENDAHEAADPLESVWKEIPVDGADALPRISKEEQLALLDSYSEGIDISFGDTQERAAQPNEVQQAMTAIATEQSADIEESGGDPGEIKVSDDFVTLSRRMNTVSAPSTTYPEACQYLSLDPRHPCIGNVTLRPFQVTGVDWMTRMEEHHGRSGILNDECGLGKTIQSLAMIALAATKASAPFKPTLVLAPSTLMDVWLREHNTNFYNELELLFWYGTVGPGGMTDPIRKRYHVSPDGIKDKLAKLDPNNPKTARVVLLSSYSTWHRRTLTSPGRSLDLGHDPGRAETLDAEDGLEDDLEDGETQNMMKSAWPGDLPFARVILDEGHTVKNASTRVFSSVVSLPTEYFWIITATSMINRVTDLFGFLKLLHKPWMEQTAPNYTHLTTLDMRGIYSNAPIQFEGDLHLLNPSLFTKLISNGSMSSASALEALPRILAKIQLRRFLGMEMETLDGAVITIGSEIPPARIRTIECDLDLNAMAIYQMMFSALAPRLKTGSEPNDKSSELELGGKFDMAVYRRLRHSAFSYALEDLFQATTAQREGNLASDIAKWREKPGSGLRWMLTRMCRDPSTPFIPADRQWLAGTLVMKCAKFRYLSAIVAHVVLKEKRRLLVFNAYPTTQFLTEQFLRVLGLRVSVLRASMSTQERSLVASQFNDPTADVDVLVVTYPTCSLGLNLHHACADMVSMEPAINGPTQCQANGRVSRMGQEHPQQIWLLSGRYTFDKFVEGNQSRKMIPQIIAMARESLLQGAPLDPGRGKPARDHDDEAYEKDADGLPDGVADDVAEHAIQMFCSLFGQESSRHDHKDATKLDLPDKLKKKLQRRQKYMALASQGSSRKVMGLSTPAHLEPLARFVSYSPVSLILITNYN